MLPALRVFGLTVPTYGVLYLLAFAAGLFTLAVLARKEGFEVYQITMLGVYCVLVSRLSSVFINALMTGTNVSLGLMQSTGAFFWALLPGLIFGFGYSKYHGLPVFRVLDCLSPALVLAQAIGRLGCFAAGCCFGKPTTSAFGVIYTDARAHNICHVPLHVAIHPTQLYESVGGVLIFVLLLWFYPRRTFPGQIFSIMLGSVSAARVIFEAFRGDRERGLIFDWLSLPRLVAAILCVVAVLLFLHLRRKETTGSVVRNLGGTQTLKTP